MTHDGSPACWESTDIALVDMQLLDLKGDYERKIFLGVITPLVMGLCAVAQPLLVTPWLLRCALRSEGELRVQRLIRIPALLAFGETIWWRP